MHELSILEEVVRIVDDLSEKQNIDSVKVIVLQIGELSEVVPRFLTEYFPIVTDGMPRFKDAKVEIETLPANAKCHDCGTVFNVIENEGYCPHCRSYDKDLLCGQEFLIKEIMV